MASSFTYYQKQEHVEHFSLLNIKTLETEKKNLQRYI